MSTLYQYRVYCTSDQQYETVWLETTDPTPSVCPINGSHGIDTTITSIIDKSSVLYSPMLHNPLVASDIIFISATNNLNFHIEDQDVGVINATLTIPDIEGSDSQIITDTTTQTLYNKTHSEPFISGNMEFTSAGYMEFLDIGTPSNSADGAGKFYKKTGEDGVFWLPDSGGTEVDLTHGEDHLPLTAKGDILVHNGSGLVAIPALSGSDGYVLTLTPSDGAGNGVSWVDSSQTFITKLWFITDHKGTGLPGQDTVAATWVTRDLNTMQGSDFTELSLNTSTSQFTLTPGVYEINGSAPGFFCTSHRTRIQNITDATTDAYGTSEYANNNNVTTRSEFDERVTITTTSTFELQHYTTKSKTGGFGVATGVAGVDEIYSTIRIQRLGEAPEV